MCGAHVYHSIRDAWNPASREPVLLTDFAARHRTPWQQEMDTNFFYVYALKDPRTSPALPFYIGKGAGSRAFDHLVTPDATRKYARIKEIAAYGVKPLVEILVEGLAEFQALRIEAELIAAFGTVDSGGLLTNTVMPSGLGGKKRDAVVVPLGCVERAQLGLQLLKTAIVDFTRANPSGITNSDAASLLGLRSDYRGRQKDYLSYSVLGLLLREGKVVRDPGTLRHKAAVSVGL
jgi:uncharacterized protein